MLPNFLLYLPNALFRGPGRHVPGPVFLKPHATKGVAQEIECLTAGISYHRLFRIQRKSVQWTGTFRRGKGASSRRRGGLGGMIDVAVGWRRRLRAIDAGRPVVG